MTKAEIIDTLKTAIAEVEWNYPLNYAVAFEEAIEMLRKYEPVRQGEWVLCAGFYICNQCGCSPAEWEESEQDGRLPPYCHCCGAKMDLEVLGNAND